MTTRAFPAAAPLLKVSGCECPGTRHVKLALLGREWGVTLQPEDAAVLAAWLDAPGDSVTFANTGGEEGDGFSRAALQVVPTLQGERLVSLTLLSAPTFGVVRLTLGDARDMAAHVRELAAPEAPARKPDRGVLASVSIPDTYALQLTLRGDQLRWLSHALATLCSALSEIHPTIAGLPRDVLLLGIREELRKYTPAATSFLNTAAAVYDVLEQVSTQLRTEGKIP